MADLVREYRKAVSDPEIDSLRRACQEQGARIARLEEAVRSILEEWQPSRTDYRSDNKGDRQYEQARACWQAAHNTLMEKLR